MQDSAVTVCHTVQDARCFASQLCEEWRSLLEAQEAEAQADSVTRQARFGLRNLWLSVLICRPFGLSLR